MFTYLSSQPHIVVIGPQRSGTTIATAMIAHDTGHTAYYEEDFDIENTQLWRSLIKRKNVVVQCPTMFLPACHLPADYHVICVKRPLSEIRRSEKRIEWQNHRQELAKFGETEGHPARIKYDYWHVNRPRNSSVIYYKHLATHPLFETNRGHFHPRQVSRSGHKNR